MSSPLKRTVSNEFVKQTSDPFIGLLFRLLRNIRWIPIGNLNGEFRWPVTNDQFFPDIVIGLLLVWSGSVFSAEAD